MKNIIISSLLVFSVSVLAQRGPTPVFSKEAKSEEIVNRQKVTGSLSAPKVSDVASIEAGRVEEVHIKRGQRVKTGDILVVLDNRHLKHDIAIIEAQSEEIDAGIARLKGELQIQKEDLQALQNANKKFKGSVSDKDIRTARLAVTTTEGHIIEMEARKPTLNAQLKKLETSLADAVVKAPFDGVILERYTDKGAWLGMGGKVARLQSFDLKVALEIPESIKPSLLTEGAVTAYAGKTELKLSNFRILREVNKESRNYTLLATINNDMNLLPGMSVTAVVPQGDKKKHLLIPTDAIQRNGAGYFVYKVVPGEKGTMAMPVNIQILFRYNDYTAAVSPMIKNGDAVVVEGNERLFPMTPVKATPQGK